MKRIISVSFVLVLAVLIGIAYAGPKHGATEFGGNITTSSGATIDGIYSSDAYATFASAISAIGSTNATLHIKSAETVSADVTVPTTMELMFTRNGSLSIDTGMTVTINGPLDAGLHQIFSGSGSVVFGNGIIGGMVSEVFPQWWGAKADSGYGGGGTDDIIPIQAAVDSLGGDSTAQLRGGWVTFIGAFRIDSVITLKRRVSIKGTNAGQGVYWSETYPPNSMIYNTGTGVTIDISDNPSGSASPNYGTIVKDIYLKGDADTSHAIYINDVYRGRIENVIFERHGGSGIYADYSAQWEIIGNYFWANNKGISTNADTNGWNIEGNYVGGSKVQGMYLDSFWGGTISANVIEGTVDTGTNAEIFLREPRGVALHGNYFEGNAYTAIFVNHDAHAVDIRGNFINGYSYGIYIRDDTHNMETVIIQGNHIRGATIQGVYVASGTATLRMSNVILGPNSFSDNQGDYSVGQPYRYGSIGGTGTARQYVIYDDTAQQWETNHSYYDSSGTRGLRSVSYVIGANDRLYKAAIGGTAGATIPSGTGTGIDDGGVTWDYVSGMKPFETMVGSKQLTGNFNMVGAFDVDGTSATSGTSSFGGNVAISAGGVFNLDAESTFANSDTSPSVSAGNLFAMAATPNGATIVDLNDGVAGQMVNIRAVDDASDLTDGGNFNLNGNFTGDADDIIQLYTPDGTTWYEISRSAN